MPEALEIEAGGADYNETHQEAPLTTLQRLKHSICPPSRSADPRCASCAGDALLELAARPAAVDKLWTPLKALANNPIAALAGLAALYLLFCLFYLLWYPFAYVGGEYFAWFVFLFALRKAGSLVARFAVYPGSFKAVRDDVEKCYARRLEARLDACAAAMDAYASAMPRAAKGSFLPNLDARRLFLGKCRRDAEAAALQVLRPLADDLDAIAGRGGHERGDLADAPEALTPAARAARVELRLCVVAAADAVESAAADAAAATNVARCARALSQAAADLHPSETDEAPSTAAAARVMKDAGGFVLRALKGGLCPAASGATAGLGLLRAEFVRRYDGRQVWVDGVDCCVVPPFKKGTHVDVEAPPPSPKAGGCCRRHQDPGAVAQPIATVLFFAPNAVLYESCGMAPADGASWVATYARLGYQVVVWNARGYGRTRGTPAPAATRQDARAVATYLLERCGVPRLLLHGESIGGLAACGTADALTNQTTHRIALVADRTFSDLRCEAQYLTGLDACSALLRLVTGWSANDTDGVGAFLRAKCAKLAANDCRDHMIPDAASMKSGIGQRHAFGHAACTSVHLSGALKLSDARKEPPAASPAPALSEPAVAHLTACVRHVHRASRAVARAHFSGARTAGADAVLVAASVLGRVDGGCGSSLGRSCERGLGDARAWVSAVAAWPHGAERSLLRARLCVRHHDDSDSDYEDDEEDERGPPPLSLAQAADALGRVVKTRRADLGDAADAVAYTSLFLQHLATAAPAPDSCGSFVALSCGHNAPWRRRERDALCAWLEVQLPPSS